MVTEVAADDSVSKIKALGEHSCNEFVNKRMIYRTNTVNETIPRTNVSLESTFCDMKNMPIRDADLN